MIIPNLLQKVFLQQMQELAKDSLAAQVPPLELEAQLGYPGAPELDQQGGATVRRLLGAYARHDQWAQWAKHTQILGRLQQLMRSQSICLSQVHHNCLMTKSPKYSSDTGWHQDVRYWSFERPELVSVWTALGDEREENGGLVVIPGSHKMELSAERFDAEKFLRQDLKTNQPLIAQSQRLVLEPGDVLFFDCKLLHRASRNRMSKTKLSLVFTYHARTNYPLPGTRSASQESVCIS